MEILGLFLFLLSGLLLVALITADKNDPSFTNISSATVSNWLGPIGANISAALFSVIGLAAFFGSCAFVLGPFLLSQTVGATARP